MLAQPARVARSGDAENLRSGKHQQLHHETAHPTGGGGNGNRLTGLRRDRTHSRVRRRTYDVQRTRYFPVQFGRLVNQLIYRNGGVGGMAGSSEAETQNLVTDREFGDARADVGHYAGKVATLPG